MIRIRNTNPQLLRTDIADYALQSVRRMMPAVQFTYLQNGQFRPGTQIHYSARSGIITITHPEARSKKKKKVSVQREGVGVH